MRRKHSSPTGKRGRAKVSLLESMQVVGGVEKGEGYHCTESPVQAGYFLPVVGTHAPPYVAHAGNTAIREKRLQRHRLGRTQAKLPPHATPGSLQLFSCS